MPTFLLMFIMLRIALQCYCWVRCPLPVALVHNVVLELFDPQASPRPTMAYFRAYRVTELTGLKASQIPLKKPEYKKLPKSPESLGTALLDASMTGNP